MASYIFIFGAEFVAGCVVYWTIFWKLYAKCKEMDFHCRLIVSIIIPNCSVVFSIYDCNGTNISIHDLIKNDCNELLTNNMYSNGYTWFNSIFTDITCLNGIGYFLNQWIKYTNHNLYEIECISSCYLLHYGVALALLQQLFIINHILFSNFKI